MNECFWVYILRCENNTLYTGYTNNLLKRYRSHVNGTAKCKYTRSFKPLYLAQCWPIFTGKSQALRLEKRIKKLTRPQKEFLIAQPALIASLIS